MHADTMGYCTRKILHTKKIKNLVHACMPKVLKAGGCTASWHAVIQDAGIIDASAETVTTAQFLHKIW